MHFEDQVQMLEVPQQILWNGAFLAIEDFLGLRSSLET